MDGCRARQNEQESTTRLIVPSNQGSSMRKKNCGFAKISRGLWPRVRERCRGRLGRDNQPGINEGSLSFRPR